MKKIFSLLKANIKGNLNIFKIKGKKNISIFLTTFVILYIMYIAYFYSEQLMIPLQPLGLSYIALTLFSIAIVILLFMREINNSQGLLFDAQDNDLLFSMPIKKSNILIVRIIKMLLFDYILEIIFFIPVLIKYVLLNSPSITFYIVSIIFLLLLPLIPIIIACIVGYIIKSISILFKRKKLAQIITSLIFVFLIIILSFNIGQIFDNLVAKATSINDLISKIYLPIGLYVDLINKLDILKLIILIVISIVPFILFILLFSKYYDKIINSSKEVTNKKIKENKLTKITSHSIIKTLIIKEIKNYFSIPIYVVNTILSPIMALIFSIALIFKYDGVISTLTSPEIGLTISQIIEYSPYLFIAIIVVLLSISSITASSISLEGKRYPLLKSLPIKEKDIFLSKLLLNDIILIPAFIISALIYIVIFKIYNINILFIIISCIILPHINGQIGLLINLRFPKLKFNSEMEVVKQSMSVAICVFGNMILASLLIYSFIRLMSIVSPSILIIIYLLGTLIILLILNKILNSYGVNRFKEIN